MSLTNSRVYLGKRKPKAKGVIWPTAMAQIFYQGLVPYCLVAELPGGLLALPGPGTILSQSVTIHPGIRCHETPTRQYDTDPKLPWPPAGGRQGGSGRTFRVERGSVFSNDAETGGKFESV